MLPTLHRGPRSPHQLRTTLGAICQAKRFLKEKTHGNSFIQLLQVLFPPEDLSFDDGRCYGKNRDRMTEGSLGP